MILKSLNKNIIYIIFSIMLVLLAVSTFVSVGMVEYIMYVFGTIMVVGLIVILIGFVKILLVKIRTKF